MQLTAVTSYLPAMRRCGLACAEARASSQALKPARLWDTLGQAVRKVSAMLGQLLSLELRRTTLLLLFIWWANAVVYYGLVLLATTVSFAGQLASCPGLHLLCWIAMQMPFPTVSERRFRLLLTSPMLSCSCMSATPEQLVDQMASPICRQKPSQRSSLRRQQAGICIRA